LKILNKRFGSDKFKINFDLDSNNSTTGYAIVELEDNTAALKFQDVINDFQFDKKHVLKAILCDH